MQRGNQFVNEENFSSPLFARPDQAVAWRGGLRGKKSGDRSLWRAGHTSRSACWNKKER